MPRRPLGLPTAWGGRRRRPLVHSAVSHQSRHLRFPRRDYPLRRGSTGRIVRARRGSAGRGGGRAGAGVAPCRPARGHRVNGGCAPASRGRRPCAPTRRLRQPAIVNAAATCTLCLAAGRAPTAQITDDGPGTYRGRDRTFLTCARPECRAVCARRALACRVDLHVEGRPSRSTRRPVRPVEYYDADHVVPRSLSRAPVAAWRTPSSPVPCARHAPLHRTECSLFFHHPPITIVAETRPAAARPGFNSSAVPNARAAAARSAASARRCARFGSRDLAPSQGRRALAPSPKPHRRPSCQGRTARPTELPTSSLAAGNMASAAAGRLRAVEPVTSPCLTPSRAVHLTAARGAIFSEGTRQRCIIAARHGRRRGQSGQRYARRNLSLAACAPRPARARREIASGGSCRSCRGGPIEHCRCHSAWSAKPSVRRGRGRSAAP